MECTAIIISAINIPLKFRLNCPRTRLQYVLRLYSIREISDSENGSLVLGCVDD